MERYYTEDRLIENIYAPYPLGRRIPLSDSHPEIAAQWLYSKNCGYGPEDFSYGSNVKAWWRCDANRKHIWQCAIDARTCNFATGCPHCYDESWGIDLTEFPKVLKLFDRSKNAGIEPNKIPSGHEISWRCPKSKDHVWCSRFNINVVDEFCPFCRGRRASETNSLAHYRDITRQWHPTKNGKLRPKDVPPGSKKFYWFKCNAAPDHVFEARPRDRVIEGFGCPYCSRRRFSSTASLQTLNPEIAKQWHPSRNGKLTPENISAASTKKVWWKCDNGPDHQWKGEIKARTARDLKCPFCANRRLSETNCLANLHPDLAREFDLNKNAPATPETVNANTTQEYWWKCKNKHSWLRAVYLRTQRQSRCPECPKPKKEVEKPLSLEFPAIASEWHPQRNGKLTPHMVSSSHHRQSIWWQCKAGPDHIWKTFVAARTKEGRGCPCCSGKKLSVTNSLAVTHPNLAKEWHPTKNRKNTPELVLPRSAQKFWWLCSNCKNEWRREPYLRTERLSKCPACGHYPKKI